MSEQAQEPPDRGFWVSLRVTAVSSLLFAFACLVTLVIIGFANDADGLATIALLLAVLAFAIQIVVYIVQSWQSTQQAVRAEQLNGDTQKLVARLDARAEETHRKVGFQTDTLIAAVIDMATGLAEEKLGRALTKGEGMASPADKPDFDPKEFEAELLEKVKQAFTPPVTTDPRTGLKSGNWTTWPGPDPYRGGEIIFPNVTTYPSITTYEPFESARKLQEQYREAKKKEESESEGEPEENAGRDEGSE